MAFSGLRNLLSNFDEFNNFFKNILKYIIFSRSKGFVLDGFPNNESEASYLIEKGFFPDSVVMLNVSDENIIKRLLPTRLQRWRQKMQAKKEKKKEKREKKKKDLVRILFDFIQ